MARKSARRTKKQKLENNVIEFESVKLNNKTKIEGPKRKSWNVLDIKPIKPLNESQRQMLESFYMGNHVVAAGSAGTGKSMLAIWMALNMILSKEYEQNNLIIVRSIVPTRDIGFLKGTEEEKIAAYETPYIDIFTDLFGKPSTYADMKEAGKVTFMPTSFVRGQTWDNAIIIIEEFQSMNFQELSSVITRTGKHSKVIVTGDHAQNDLYTHKNEKSCFHDFMKVAKLMKEFDIINFTRNDIVRSQFTKSFICACEDIGVG